MIMKDEIKEINIPKNVLVALGDLTNGALNYYKATETVKVKYSTILDYITNLQEEKERLKDELKYTIPQVQHNQIVSKLTKEKNDYKSRCEKAIDNLEKSIKSINKKLLNNKESYEVIDGKIIHLNDYQVCRLKAIRMKCKEVLKILRGSDTND